MWVYLGGIRALVESAAASRADAWPRPTPAESGAGLLAESRRFDRQMRLVLKARVLALDKQGRGVRDRFANGFDPPGLRLGEVTQHVIMNERLVAGVADADPHALVVVADMGADRAQSVMAGIAAADLYPDLGGREIEFVVNNEERACVELPEAQRFADAASGFVHEGLRLEQHDPNLADQPLGR